MLEPITYTHLLRVEGVNLYGFVLDTQQLSAIRGGGLMLLKAVDAAEAAVETTVASINGRYAAISTGASSGVFGLTVTSDEDAKAVAAAVVAALAQDIYRHASFVVDVVVKRDVDESFRHDIEATIAANRVRQYRMPALQVPVEGQQACEVNGILPAAEGATMSASVTERIAFGRQTKQDFYDGQLRALGLETEDILPRLPKDFAADFKGIAALHALQRHLPESLNNKLAVFYADGNKFGAIGASAKDADVLQNWDVRIKTLRRELLRDLLVDIGSHCELVGAPVFQFETLLWGGDELMFVMPAWAGLAFAARFFELTADWDHDKKALTHCAGLAFCHYNAPIHAIADLVRTLADSAKAHATANTNALQYVVLESFDHTGADWKKFLHRVYGGKLNVTDRIIEISAGNTMTNFIEQIKAITLALPRSRLTPWIQHLLSPDVSDKDKSTKALDRLTHDLSSLVTEKAPWQQRDLATWAHIAELWDYAVNIPVLRQTVAADRTAAPPGALPTPAPAQPTA